MAEWIDPFALPAEDEQRRLHIERYVWAEQHLRGQFIANAACSCNYGADILMRAKPNAIRVVVGFDRNKEALKIARERYAYPVIDCDIQDQTFHGFGALVCLETFEHLERPWDFLKALSGTVKELVISVPIIPTKHFNEFHLHDFTKEDIVKGLADAGWEILADGTQDEDMLTKPTYYIAYAVRKAKE